MNEMNQRLSEDVHQLTVGWNEAQNQLKEKDEMWHKILTVLDASCPAPLSLNSTPGGV